MTGPWYQPDLQASRSSTVLHSIYGSRASALPFSKDCSKENTAIQNRSRVRPKSSPAATHLDREDQKERNKETPPHAVTTRFPRPASARASSIPEVLTSARRSRPKTAVETHAYQSDERKEDYQLSQVKLKDPTVPVYLTRIPEYFNFWAGKPLLQKDLKVETHQRKRRQRPKSDYGTRFFHRKGDNSVLDTVIEKDDDATKCDKQDKGENERDQEINETAIITDGDDEKLAGDKQHRGDGDMEGLGSVKAAGDRSLSDDSGCIHGAPRHKAEAVKDIQRHQESRSKQQSEMWARRVKQRDNVNNAMAKSDEEAAEDPYFNKLSSSVTRLSNSCTSPNDLDPAPNDLDPPNQGQDPHSTKDFKQSISSTHLLGMPSTSEALDESNTKNAPSNTDWLDGHRCLNRSTRFELPIDLKLLEGMTPTQYLSKYCIVSPHRRSHYLKTFSKMDINHDFYLNREEVITALIEVYHSCITQEQVENVLQVAQFPPDMLVDLQLFSSLASLVERMLSVTFLAHYRTWLTDHPTFSSHVILACIRIIIMEHIRSAMYRDKELIETADFEAIEWKLRGCNISIALRTLFSQL